MTQAYFLSDEKRVDIPQETRTIFPSQHEVENLRNEPIDHVLDILASALLSLSKLAIENHNLSRYSEGTGWSEETIIETFENVKLMGSKEYLHTLLESQLRNIRFLDEWLQASGEVCFHAEPLGQGVNIGAGNSPISSILPEIWRCLTKNACVHKMPSGDRITLELLNRVYMGEEKFHPLKSTFVASYWPGGCEEIERSVLASVDFVMAWGSDSHVESARLRTPFPVRFLGFGQEYGMALIDDTILSDGEKRKKASEGIALDVSFGDQMYCTSTQFGFVDGKSVGNVERFLEDLSQSMDKLRTQLRPGTMGESTRMDIRQARESAMISGDKCLGPNNLDYLITYCEDLPTELGLFPQHRFLRIYKMNEFSETFRYANRNMNNISLAVADDARRHLRREFSKRGVKRIVSPGGTLPAYPVIPWGAEFPLARLVEWHTDEYTMLR